VDGALMSLGAPMTLVVLKDALLTLAGVQMTLGAPMSLVAVGV
jgi:hypothetical protein